MVSKGKFVLGDKLIKLSMKILGLSSIGGKIYKNVCDCCGRPLDYIPWKVKYGLCDECDAVHSIKIDNIPWRNKINSNKRICWR